jgi:hypothetical protein
MTIVLWFMIKHETEWQSVSPFQCSICHPHEPHHTPLAGKIQVELSTAESLHP